jgi:hypothetical protein
MVDAASDGDARDAHIVAGHIMLHPHRRIPYSHVLNRYVSALDEPDDIGTHLVRPFERPALPVDCAPADDGDFVKILAVNKALVRIVVRVRSEGLHRRWVILQVFAAQQSTSGVELERHAGFHINGA